MLLHLKNEYHGLVHHSFILNAGAVVVKAEIMPINIVLKVIKKLCLLNCLSFLIINTVFCFFL